MHTLRHCLWAKFKEPKGKPASFLITAALLFAAPSAAEDTIRFKDVTDQVGLHAHLGVWRLAHGAAWGDADGDGRPDLYMGTFADRPRYGLKDAPIPNPLFLNREEGFVLSAERSVRLEGKRARTTMALFVDLDNDGDLDLLAGNNCQQPDGYGSAFFENVGDGRFKNVTERFGESISGWAVRNIAAIDLNRDGLLDLLLTDGYYSHVGNERGRLRVLENKSGWRFEDAAARYGLDAPGTPGLGLALGDVNNDGRLDVFVANGNRLFVSGPDGLYTPSPDNPFVARRGGAWPCGAVFGDLNGDDLLDMALTVHGVPGELHVYLNRGIVDGMPRLELVRSERFPSKGHRTGLPVKAAQVSLADMDNDGRRDIVLGAVYEDNAGRIQPVVARNTGNDAAGTPQFAVPPLQRTMGYYAAAPVADYDRDGRLDIFLAAWFDELSNTLFRNTSEAGHWLTVRVRGMGQGLNPMGIGAIVRIYEAGKAGQQEHQLGRHDISIGNGYSSGEEALAHFGLGERVHCDVVVNWGPHREVIAHAEADRFLVVEMGGKTSGRDVAANSGKIVEKYAFTADFEE